MENFEGEEIRFTMRMDPSIYEKLKKSAKKNKRSTAKELEFITDFYFKEMEQFTSPEYFAKQEQQNQKMVELLAQVEFHNKKLAEFEERFRERFGRDLIDRQ